MSIDRQVGGWVGGTYRGLALGGHANEFVKDQVHALEAGLLQPGDLPLHEEIKGDFGHKEGRSGRVGGWVGGWVGGRQGGGFGTRCFVEEVGGWVGRRTVCRWRCKWRCGFPRP